MTDEIKGLVERLEQCLDGWCSIISGSDGTTGFAPPRVGPGSYQWIEQVTEEAADALTLSDEARVRAEEALALALEMLGRLEPGDSRAVSSEFVAMACVAAGTADDECMEIIRKAQALILRAEGEGSSRADECGAGSQANLADLGGGSFDGCEPTAVTEAIELATAGLKRGAPTTVVIRDLLKALGRPAPSRPDCSAAQSLDGGEG